jgi:hypothetical protein
MVERRNLIDGLTPPAASAEQRFVSGAKSSNGYDALRKATTDASGASLSTRIRPEFVALLKRASLERKLNGIEPNSLRDMLEDALEPWLRAQGYLP